LLQWLQASLPVKCGGLGIRRAAALALPAFLSSSSNTAALQDLVLLCTAASTSLYYQQYLTVWTSTFNQPCPTGDDARKQRSWDEPAIKMEFSSLSANADPANLARLLAVSAPHSSDWLHALPIASCGLRLNDEDIRVAIGLRLGTALCKPHQCSCGAQVDANGLHGLSCKQSNGRHARHNTVNDIVVRALCRADTPAVKEPSGLSRSDGKRPDGLTLVPWACGRPAIWDVTITDTLAQSYVALSSEAAGSAAELAASRKNAKYIDLSRNHVFFPIAIETLGPICAEGRRFLRELGTRITAVTGDTRETAFLFQRLSIAVQHFNSILFRSTFGDLSANIDDA
jgi:hypothetical protein